MTRTNKGLLMKDDLIINHRLIPYTCLFKPKYRRNKLITVNKTRNLKPFLLCFQSRCCQEVDHWVPELVTWSLPVSLSLSLDTGTCDCSLVNISIISIPCYQTLLPTSFINTLLTSGL